MVVKQDTTVIIGAGPYGLSTAAHLNAQKMPILIFGKPMEFWRKQQHADFSSFKGKNSYPALNKWFESSVPHLYFVGAPAGHNFGPLCRFVTGAKVPARQIACQTALAI